jgi:hypothetical protein
VKTGIDASPEDLLKKGIGTFAAIRRETVANRTLTVGLGKYYGQKFGMNQDKDCYEWLGDYPKVAAERRGGLVTTGEIR